MTQYLLKIWYTLVLLYLETVVYRIQQVTTSSVTVNTHTCHTSQSETTEIIYNILSLGIYNKMFHGINRGNNIITCRLFSFKLCVTNCIQYYNEIDSHIHVINKVQFSFFLSLTPQFYIWLVVAIILWMMLREIIGFKSERIYSGHHSVF